MAKKVRHLPNCAVEEVKPFILTGLSQMPDILANTMNKSE